MSQVCPKCGTELGASGICPKCGWAAVQAAARPEARFVEDPKSFDWRPWVLTLIGLLVLCLFMGYRSRERDAQRAQELAADAGRHSGKIGGSSLIDLPPSDEPQPTGAILAANPSPASKPSPAAATDATDQTQADDGSTPPATTQDTPTENPNQPSLVQIGLAQIATEQDDSGNSFAVGHVTLVNTGPSEITGFTLSLTTADGSFALVPFQGTIENPVEITTRRIPPGGYLDVPVMTQGVFQSSAPGGQKLVTVSATENGQAITDSTTIQ